MNKFSEDNYYFFEVIMDVLYTSFLQKLVQSSNAMSTEEQVQEKAFLNLLAFLSLKLKESETLLSRG